MKSNLKTFTTQQTLPSDGVLQAVGHGFNIYVAEKTHQFTSVLSSDRSHPGASLQLCD